jgi:hypothetical protein
MVNGWDVKKNTSGISLDPNACGPSLVIYDLYMEPFLPRVSGVSGDYKTKCLQVNILNIALIS